ncbi:hypothetical protein EXIGLDRAFT_700069 [Exidia glandulosa HHB12029]|uniref:Hydrophobic surface binding protein n=1 Tax=Exidia glandulosa HHB12029 TaxID=1314781 RepID=A0A165M6R5_EXIGL|nr:hypothetical protein EXIGLDRAFT_700069 [Exidia glandulosa HHB12029]
MMLLRVLIAVASASVVCAAALVSRTAVTVEADLNSMTAAATTLAQGMTAFSGSALQALNIGTAETSTNNAIQKAVTDTKARTAATPSFTEAEAATMLTKLNAFTTQMTAIAKKDEFASLIVPGIDVLGEAGDSVKALNSTLLPKVPFTVTFESMSDEFSATNTAYSS